MNPIAHITLPLYTVPTLSLFLSHSPPKSKPISTKSTVPSLSLSLSSNRMGQNILEALNVRVVGSGERVLVLAHGFGTDQSAWHLILPFFTQTYRVVLYDLVCAGSVNPDYFDFDRYTTLDAYVDDLLNILDSLQIRCCAYVGHSVSAMIGILASIRRPDLFSKLILVGASPRFLNDDDYHGGFEESEIEKVFSAMEANYEAWVHGYAPLAVGADVPTAVREF
ncbi:PREDICTED: strigolactone esterase D14-like, partial [Tarenaya hassleriana]|uniref:strigolactone esterase D14-like n=1 Tax=Tarenaya hassleriana TaxID=28532 RepID=UPI00053C8FDB